MSFSSFNIEKLVGVVFEVMWIGEEQSFVCYMHYGSGLHRSINPWLEEPVRRGLRFVSIELQETADIYTRAWMKSTGVVACSRTLTCCNEPGSVTRYGASRISSDTNLHPQVQKAWAASNSLPHKTKCKRLHCLIQLTCSFKYRSWTRLICEACSTISMNPSLGKSRWRASANVWSRLPMVIQRPSIVVFVRSLAYVTTIPLILELGQQFSMVWWLN